MADEGLKVKVELDGTDKVKADAASLSEQLKKSFAPLTQISGPAGEMFKLLEGGFAALLTPVGLLAGGLTALVGVLTKATNTVQQTYVEMRNLSAVTGTSIEETNVLSDAFKLMGFETGALQTALFRLSMEVEGGGRKLAAYGISVRDIDGNLKATGDVFEETVKRIGQIGDAAQRNAALMQLFGRAGRELAPIFQAGGASLDEFKKKAQDAGILTKEDAAAALELKRAQAALADGIEDLWIVLGRQLLPVMEAGVKTLNFFVEGITAIIGIGTEWIKWMVTSKEALDPLSLSLKAVALSINLIVKGVGMIKGMGKWIADKLVPVPSGSDEAKQAEKVSGPIITSDDVNEQAKLRDAQLKMDQQYFSDVRFLETGSKAERIKVNQEYSAQLIEVERKKAKDLLSLTDDPIKKEKIAKELQMKELQFEGEKRLQLLKLREAETEDAKQAFDDRLKAQKIAGEQQIGDARRRADDEMKLIDRVATDEKSKIEDRKTVEVNVARDVSSIKKQNIQFEIDGLKQIAAADQQNAVLQRESRLKLMDLNHQLTQTQLEEIKQVGDARAKAAAAEEARQEKAAGFLGQLTKMATDFAKAQGRASITTDDISKAMQQQSQMAQQQLATFFAGGAVDPTKLQAAAQFQQFQRQMTQAGVSTSDVLSAGFKQTSQTFGAGFGFEASTKAFERGDIAGGEMLQKRAQMQGDIEMAALGVGGGDKVGAMVGQIKDRGDQAITVMVGKIPTIMGDWFTNFTDQMVRKLEMEASRT